MDYPYLWAWQAGRGETEGRKTRPCAVAVALRRTDGQHAIFLLAVTSRAPGAERQAIEVPETERRRAGLTEDRALWIVLDEYNADVVETSFYLEADARIGRFGASFLRQVQERFRAVLAQPAALGVRRDD
ncbi:hypothetical protein P1J78_08325 [Psychromarinibacter sp. C21-152]|uniref:PemK-like, MazF-like toxin of type II toxin-antitoxin system n=1 Tax=Psychromarinibacter sediminicola TaxID=3033385 RepID=A0AAE3NNS9_9RHOB|nr:hypothetical protein [Psychromarinibacter sediminicola]MDF0600733.1 hypothetical protein [Psychromarinibacter sediminicola]